MASSCRQAACSKDGPALLTQEHEQPQHLVTSNTSNTNYAPTAHEETKSLPLKSINIQRHHLTIPSPTFVVCQRTAWRSCRSITLHHTCSTFKQYQLSEHRDIALIKYTKHLPPTDERLILDVSKKLLCSCCTADSASEAFLMLSNAHEVTAHFQEIFQLALVGAFKSVLSNSPNT